jgi:hypothetical protein
MKHHLFCLTIDTDPDGLSGISTNRRALSWDGLIQAQELPHDLQSLGNLLNYKVPMTWFIRADGQLRDRFGTSQYLIERFNSFWRQIGTCGHELGWHPHLYRQLETDDEPILITEPVEACDELERLWHDWTDAWFTPAVFRHGEGWHCPQTISMVEKFGFICDSTAIPGRRGGAHHPMDWMGTPNHPYFPDNRDIRLPGRERPLLEMPMNTWLVKAPYDSEPKVRYMNPAVHESIFDKALDDWEILIKNSDVSIWVWVLVFHPDEVMPMPDADSLYAHSRQTLCRNVRAMTARVREVGHSFEFVTISEAAKRWRQQEVLKL